MSKTETGAQLLARLGARPSLEHLEDGLFENELKSGDVYEFYGEEGVGKSVLLQHILTKIILPRTLHGVDIGGCGAKVIFIDTDFKFNILHVAKQIKHIIRKHKTEKAIELHDNDVEKCVEESLKNLFIVRCTSSEQLIWTVHGLTDILNINPEIGMIMLDCISTFYYVDKSCNMLETNISLLVNALEKLIIDYKLIVLVTKSALVKRKSPILKTNKVLDPYQYAEFLGNKWHGFVQKRFILIKDDSSNQLKYGIYCKHFDSPKYFHITEYGVVF